MRKKENSKFAGAQIVLADKRTLRMDDIVRTNKSGTRLTMKGVLGGKTVFIKYYRGVLGVIRGMKTKKSALRLRSVAADSAPELLYADRHQWFKGFYLVYTEIPGEKSLSEFKNARHKKEAIIALEQTVALIARLHDGGAIQRDTNLTNFMQYNNNIYLLDDDDIVVYKGPVKGSMGAANLASILARIEWLDCKQLAALISCYYNMRWGRPGRPEEIDYFIVRVNQEKALRAKKRAKESVHQKR